MSIGWTWRDMGKKGDFWLALASWKGIVPFMANEETAEVSVHLLKVFLFVERKKGWVTAADVADGAKVGPRTARSHCLRLVKLGLFDQADVFPAHRYHLSPMCEKRNKTMLQRLREAQKVMGEE